jgi:hypothetical protein
MVQLQNIYDNSHSIETKNNNTKYLWEEIKNNLTEEFNASKSTTIYNPKPNGVNITPSYINNYGPITEKNTSLGSIYRESEIFKYTSFELISNIIEVIKVSNNELGNTKSGLKRVSEELNNSVTKIEDAIVSTIGEYYKYFDDVDSYVRKTMNILFSLNLAIVVFFGVSIVFLLCCKCGGIFVCISWFFIYNFMLISLLLGCVLGIVSAFIKGTSSATKYLIQHNIDKINFGETDVLNSCLNGNGSLSNVGSITLDFDSSIVNNIYNLDNNITYVINYIDNYKFNSFKNNEETYELLKNEPHKVTNELGVALNTINNKVLSCHDRWEITKEDCGSDYYPLQKVSYCTKVFNCIIFKNTTLISFFYCFLIPFFYG